MPLYDYGCSQGHITEVRAGYDVTTLPCPACGEQAGRLAVYHMQYIIGETVAKGVCKATRAGNIKDKHGRTRLSLFQEASAEIDHAHGKAEQEVGHELPSPPLYKTALKRAEAIGAKRARQDR